MWRVPIILNTALVCLFGVFSMGSQFALYNRYVTYAGSDMRPLPAISDWALRYWWLYAAIPLAWIVLLAVLLLRFHRSGITPTNQNIHTSTSLFFGFLMLGVFVFAGIVPFVSIVVGMKK